VAGNLRRIPIKFGGLQNDVDQTQIQPGRAYSGSNFSVDNGILQRGPGDNVIATRPGYSPSDVAFGMGYGKYAVNQIYTLSVSGGLPTSGSVTLEFDLSVATITAPWNATAAQLQSSINSIPLLPGGVCNVSGGPWPLQPMQVSFGGAASASSRLPFVVSATTFNNSATITCSQNGITPGVYEAFLVFVQPGGTGLVSLYAVTSIDGFQTLTNTTWTALASSLAASTWKSAQYQDKVYLANPGNGLAWFQLGGQFSIPQTISSQPALTTPTIVSATPTPVYSGGLIIDNSVNPHFTFSFGNWGATNPAVSHSLSSLLTLALASAISTPTAVSITYTPASAIDFSRQHYWQVQIACSESGGGAGDIPTPQFSSITLALTNSAGNTIYALQEDGGNNYNGNSLTGFRGFYFGEATEVQMETVTSITITFIIDSASAKSILNILINPADTWLNDSLVSLSILEGPTSQPISYAASFMHPVSTGNQALTESLLSLPTQTVAVPPPGPSGTTIVVTVDTDLVHLTGADYIRLYRLDEYGIWRMIAQQVQGAGGTVAFSDYYMADEITSFPAYGFVTLPGGFTPSAIGVWKGCLVLGCGNLAFISYAGLPLLFNPAPSQFGALSVFNPNDPNVPRTVFMAPDRSEAVLTIVGQDSLYFTGQRRTYAMPSNFSNLPDGLGSPQYLPGNKGGLGTFGAYPESDGHIVGCHIGLYYFSVPAFYSGTNSSSSPVEEELTKEVTGSWASLIATNPASTVVTMDSDEVWAINGKNFLHRSRKGHWDQGVFIHSIYDAISVPGLPLIALTSDGQLVSIPYGVEATSGNWTYETGIIQSERNKLDHFELWSTGSPTVQITYFDQNGVPVADTHSCSQDLISIYPLNPAALQQGWRFIVQITSTNPTDQITGFDMLVEDLPGGKGN
jgi:hypothetical protein